MCDICRHWPALVQIKMVIGINIEQVDRLSFEVRDDLFDDRTGICVTGELS